MFSLIVCTDSKYGIGMNDGSIPFKNRNDLANFKNLTINNIVIMGRKTWDTLKSPLPNRINAVISASNYSAIQSQQVYPTIEMDSKGKLQTAILAFDSIDACIAELSKKEYTPYKKFVIGGATIYNYFLHNNLIQRIYRTIVYSDFKCDVKMVAFDKTRFISKGSTEIRDRCIAIVAGGSDEYAWMYSEYEYTNKEEVAFLDILREILDKGADRSDRTAIGTRAVFGKFLEFDLSNNTFPLGTTKQVPLRLVFEELMWFLRGQTDTRILQEKGVGVWMGNSTREFLDKRGLQHLDAGDIGPAYGFNFRHYGAEYASCKDDYTDKGCDQLSEVLRLIKTDPHSRRIIINLWNPATLDECALPPCLFMYQFFVDGDKLSCLMTQRSSDISLAGLWNVATGALLTYIIAQMTGLQPQTLKWSIGDAHIYNNQVNAAKQQISRTPRAFPKLFFKESAPSFTNGRDITEFEYSDLRLVYYNPHPSIKSIMNV